jgi:hypothetical protein
MTNEFLLYVTHKAADTFKTEINGIDMVEFHLYKVLYLLYERLYQKGIDIELPYMWYYQGTMLYPPAFQDVAGVSFNYFSNSWVKGKEGKHLISVPNLSLPIPTNKEQIDNEISALIGQIKKQNSKDQIYEYLTQNVYEYAPYDFQRTFKSFEASIKIEDYSNSKHLFKKLIKEFPEDDFKEIFDLYLEWEAMTALAFEMEEYEYIKEINLPFWHAFCHILCIEHNNLTKNHINRLKELAAKNVPCEEDKIFNIKTNFYKTAQGFEISSQNIKDVNTLNKMIREDYL